MISVYRWLAIDGKSIYYKDNDKNLLRYNIEDELNDLIIENTEDLRNIMICDNKIYYMYDKSFKWNVLDLETRKSKELSNKGGVIILNNKAYFLENNYEKSLLTLAE